MSLPTRIVIASGNPGKLAEIARLLAPLGIDVVAQGALNVVDAEETGTTFEENALIKARHASAETGLAAIADDSGLAVDALGGRPGVYSARYAGSDASDTDNVTKLLAELDGVVNRAAAFHCVACFVEPAAENALIGRGAWHGEILTAPRGAGGFGYDPVFLDPETGRSAAELEAFEKDARSHRGQALRALVEALAARAAES
jgi:XTP/dITP diphosphohydrolase